MRVRASSPTSTTTTNNSTESQSVFFETAAEEVLAHGDGGDSDEEQYTPVERESTREEAGDADNDAVEINDDDKHTVVILPSDVSLPKPPDD